jgi:hypothetical protein
MAFLVRHTLLAVIFTAQVVAVSSSFGAIVVSTHLVSMEKGIFILLS